MSDIREVVRISGDIAVVDSINASVSSEEALRASLSVPEFISVYYEGDYSVTPSAETQVLQTMGLAMRQDMTINPIPSNYGLITWNGSTLTVS